MSLKFGVASIVSFNEVVRLATLDWMDKDRVGIIIIEEKDIVHVFCGGKRKMPWLIRRDHGVELAEFNSRVTDEMVTGNIRSGLC